jgi:hypothetical protein
MSFMRIPPDSVRPTARGAGIDNPNSGNIANP